jgi:hypothetical protein
VWLLLLLLLLLLPLLYDVVLDVDVRMHVANAKLMPGEGG